MKKSKSVDDRLNSAFRRSRLFRQNPVRPASETTVDDATEIIKETLAVSLADFGLYRLDEPLVDANSDPVEINQDTIAGRYKDDLTGDIVWDRVRDRLHELKYADDPEYSTKSKAASARASIETFVADIEVGDILIVNFPKGQAFARVTSAPYHATDMPHRDVDQDHLLYRDVKFVQEDSEQIRTIPADQLPSLLRPNPRAVTAVDRDGLKTLLGTAKGLEAIIEAANDN